MRYCVSSEVLVVAFLTVELDSLFKFIFQNVDYTKPVRKQTDLIILICILREPKFKTEMVFFRR